MLNWLGSLKCPDCGGKINEDTRYCPHCGADLESTISKSPKLAQDYFEKAQKIYNQGNNFLDEALLDCELAIGYDHEFAEAYNLYGLILDAQGKTEDAIKYYQQALKLNPGLLEASANLRDAQLDQNQPEEFEKATIYESKTYDFQGVFRKTLSLLTILVLAIGVFHFIKSIYQYFEPKSTVVFEVDTSLVSSFKKTDLETVAHILTSRCQKLGYENISFHVSTQDEIIGEIPKSLSPEKIAKEIKTIGLLEFVDFGVEPQREGTEIHTDFNDKYLLNNQSTIFHTIMSNSGIKTSSVSKNQYGVYSIDFVLTDSGSEIFKDFTTTHQGKYLGIVLNGIVVSAPLINEPITGGQGSISGNFTEEEAKSLAAVLATKPLPIPIRIKQILENK